MFVSAILLAAGLSTRMGRQKALLPWEGTTLLDYQLQQLSSVDAIREILVVTGHEPRRITDIVRATARARALHNAAYASGKVSSIRAGVRAVSPAAAAMLLLAVDQPRPASVHRAVLGAYADSGAPIVVPAHNGRRGHPVLFEAALLPELLAISEDTLGIRAVMQRHAADTLCVELSDRAVNLDLNVPGDVAPREAADDSPERG